MRNPSSVHRAVYKQHNLFGLNKPSRKKLFTQKHRRPNSIAVVGGALGDEGKGRLTDELTAQFLKTHKQVVHYRDNGGSNAGHTVAVGTTKIALHQLGSGILQPGCLVILGKEMVLHPADLVAEISAVKAVSPKKNLPATLHIDEQAFLCLDVHRAFEQVLKQHSTGSSGATGRGIAPAYADVIYRHPLRVRDLFAANWETLVRTHYELYERLVQGFGQNLAGILVPQFVGDPIVVGTPEVYLRRLKQAKSVLKPYVHDVRTTLTQLWSSDTPFVFEKAQALGLDKRWGVYPDVTASNCGFDGIFSSTEGVVDHQQIAVRAAAIKATYTSSVGSRKLPTHMDESLAHRIREDANEYGATTKRPRDIVHIDIPMLSYLLSTGRVEYLLLTHLDIAYPEVPIRVCTQYTIGKQIVPYRPDQAYLNQVSPVYVELPSWDGAALHEVTSPAQLPLAAQQYVAFLTQCLGIPALWATTGPKRHQTVRWF